MQENEELLAQIRRTKKEAVKYLSTLNQLYDIEEEKNKYINSLIMVAAQTEEHRLDTKFYVQRNGVLTYKPGNKKR